MQILVTTLSTWSSLEDYALVYNEGNKMTQATTPNLNVCNKNKTISKEKYSN
jgi:hypothetical protein